MELKVNCGPGICRMVDFLKLIDRISTYKYVHLRAFYKNPLYEPHFIIIIQ